MVQPQSPEAQSQQKIMFCFFYSYNVDIQNIWKMFVF